MSARITVQIGKTPGEQHWIEDEVTRIGSDSDCTFVIRGIPAHCLTLLYRKGQYSVVNRGREIIEVHGEPLLPTATLPIRRGECVSIGSSTTLRLEIEGDPAPSRRPPSVLVDPDTSRVEADVEHEAHTDQSAKRMAILVAGVLAAAYLLFGNSPAAEQARSHAISAEFQSLVQNLQSNVPDNFDGPKRICRALQRARISELRGDSARATQEYRVAQAMISAKIGSAGAPARHLPNDARRRALDFAEARITQLQ